MLSGISVFQLFGHWEICDTGGGGTFDPVPPRSGAQGLKVPPKIANQQSTLCDGGCNCSEVFQSGSRRNSQNGELLALTLLFRYSWSLDAGFVCGSLVPLGKVRFPYGFRFLR